MTITTELIDGQRVRIAHNGQESKLQMLRSKNMLEQLVSKANPFYKNLDLMLVSTNDTLHPEVIVQAENDLDLSDTSKNIDMYRRGITTLNNLEGDVPLDNELILADIVSIAYAVGMRGTWETYHELTLNANKIPAVIWKLVLNNSMRQTKGQKEMLIHNLNNILNVLVRDNSNVSTIQDIFAFLVDKDKMYIFEHMETTDGGRYVFNRTRQENLTITHALLMLVEGASEQFVLEYATPYAYTLFTPEIVMSKSLALGIRYDYMIKHLEQAKMRYQKLSEECFNIALYDVNEIFTSLTTQK